jgi:hypothetical protein
VERVCGRSCRHGLGHHHGRVHGSIDGEGINMECEEFGGGFHARCFKCGRAIVSEET